MTNNTFRVLLLDEKEEDYLLIRHLLSQIKTAQFELFWTRELFAPFGDYDAYLLSYHLLINDIEPLDSFADKLSQLTHQVHAAPIILLTENADTGIEALQWGASDYLEREELSVSLLERSLRLTLAHAKAKKQLNESSRQAQQQEQIRDKLCLLQKITQAISQAGDFQDAIEVTLHQLRYSRYQRLLATLTLKIRQSWEIDVILQTAVVEIQRALEADRVLFYRFFDDGKGKVVNEAVLSGFPVMLNEEIVDRCCLEKCQERYQEGYIQVCPDVATANYQPCYQDLLERYQIRANVVLPILLAVTESLPTRQDVSPSSSSHTQGNHGGLAPTPRTWGLLCVQQCRQARDWTQDEINLLKQLADQLSIALALEISQREELARSNADLQNFASIVSHDLRQPLHIIADFAQLLKRRYHNQLDEKADRFIEHIVGGVERMDRQIKDLLEYSRVGSRGNPFELTDCNQILKQALYNLQIEIGTSQATIAVIDSLPMLKADAAQLVQLFQNLISNAIKYHSDVPPAIKTRAILEDDHWLFSISDNGIGMDSKYSERIFQIFQRLHTQEEYPGTGIGLAICQRIVQRHGGRIWVNSQLGQGSTFYFILPA